MSDRWDVIVVGAGSGGGVVASRLTEDPGHRVLLLEAGPDFPSLDQVPDPVLHVRLGSGVDELDWDYLERSARAALPRGRLVGGSSAVNSSFALRGQPQDYDGWAAAGAAGWGWNDVLPYFRRLENDLDFGERPEHGDGGPIKVSRKPLDDFQRGVVAACLEAGHVALDDLNAPGRVGAGPLPRNLDEMDRRQSVLITYLAAARGRPNLTVRGDTLVDRLLLDGSDQAAGVVLASGETIEAGAVILAAGAYNTPALLQRSGIGPRDWLEPLGIDVVADLPGVGAHLLDHVCTLAALDTGLAAPEGFIPIGPACKIRTRPELEVDDVKIVFIFGELFAMPGLSGFLLEVSRCTSEGTVRVAGRHPGQEPHIDHAYFSDPADLDRAVAGLREAARVAGIMAQSGMRAELLLPDAATVADEDALRQHLLDFHSTDYHPSGTCRMGDPADPLTVVDPRGRLKGFENVYVVDASIMPAVPRCNINLPTMMIGEKLAEHLRSTL